MSEDGRYGLTLIAFVGSVFSPYYAAARRRGGADPGDHCALNVALYGGRRKRWAFTERGARHVTRTSDSFAIGPSALEWDGRGLTFFLEEVTVPWPSRISGVIRVVPECCFDEDYPLDRAARHHWRPIAPCAGVEVVLSHPALRWKGRAYLDSNRGVSPLESDFVRWDWSRSSFSDGRTAVFYDVESRGAGPVDAALSLDFDPRGRVRQIDPPDRRPLRPTGWRVGRSIRSDAEASPPRMSASLEDTPFYSRSIIESRIAGEAVESIHETLDLDRFRRRWVQALLRFRAPRRK